MIEFGTKPVFIPDFAEPFYTKGTDVLSFYKTFNNTLWIVLIVFWLILFVTYRRIRKKDGSVRTKTYLYRACWLMLIPFLYLTFFFEEMWIDKSFYKACSVGGRFIYKTVQAEGYMSVRDNGRNNFYPIERYPAPPEPLDAVNSRNYAISEDQEWSDSGSRNTEKKSDEGFLFYEGAGKDRIEYRTDEDVAKNPNYSVYHHAWHDGVWKSTKLEKPVARYQYREESWGIVGWGVRGDRQYILDSQTGETLADRIHFYRGGNYWKRHTIGLLGSIDQPCATDKRFRDTKQYDDFYQYIQSNRVIKPFK